MFSFFKNWRNRRIIKNSSITETQWQQAFANLPILDRLSQEEKQHLRNLTILFLHEKSFSGTHGLEVTDEMALCIALQACLPILNLDIEWYRGWTSVIVYPEGFAPEREEVDEFGVVHKMKHSLSGESWQRGPVVLSWKASESAGDLDGDNVVIHEFVHKLDMLNGVANGFPPLHTNMSNAQWANIFADAFDNFKTKSRNGRRTGIDNYAATSPAEFIAVLSEVFFERPEVINSEYPEAYEKLKEFFRQDPMRSLNTDIRLT